LHSKCAIKKPQLPCASPVACFKVMCRIGQSHIYMVYIRHLWQGNHQAYGHIRCIYTVLANPSYVKLPLLFQLPYDITHAQIHISTHAHIYTHTYTQTNTHIHIHIHTPHNTHLLLHAAGASCNEDAHSHYFSSPHLPSHTQPQSPNTQRYWQPLSGGSSACVCVCVRDVSILTNICCLYLNVGRDVQISPLPSSAIMAQIIESLSFKPACSSLYLNHCL